MIETARTFYLFDGIPAATIAPLLESLERRTFSPGSVVLARGDRPCEMYLIQSGTAAVLAADHAGNEHQVGLLGPGEVIGGVSVFTGEAITYAVRALPGDSLDVLVVGADDFERLVTAFPEIYRNLGRALAQRLRSVTILRDAGTPPLLGYALACGVAWHTRAPVLHLVLCPHEPPPDLARLGVWLDAANLASDASLPPALLSFEPGARTVLARPEGIFGPRMLAGTIARLAAQFAHVLLQVPAELPLPRLDARLLPIAGSYATAHEMRREDTACVVVAWDENGAGPRPDREGVLRVPPLTPDEEAALAAGLLPPTGHASQAIGWAARDLTGLKVGLALGAGGMRGYAHIGALRVLQRLGVPIDYVAGTSIGGVIASCVALGYSPEEMADALDEVGGSKFRVRLPTTSLLSSDGIRVGLQHRIHGVRIEDLNLPLALVATDLVEQQEVVFHKGVLWSAMMATTAIPGVFPPVQIGSRLLVDGGVLNPVPTRVVADMGADVVLAVKLHSRPMLPDPTVEAEEASFGGRTVLQVLRGVLETMQRKIMVDTGASASVVIEPQLHGIPTTQMRNFAQGRRLIPHGEAAAEAAAARLRAALPWVGA